MNFKPLAEQTIVLTGATSGIGLVTARMAAQAHAKLVLAARNEDALRVLVNEIVGKGGKAIYVVTDVGDEAQVQALSKAAVDEYGGFDTWINDAGVSIYGRLLEIPTEDHRKLFDTNFWGIVYGSLEAARHFKARGGNYAGVIINLGSTVSDQSLPVQGMYATSKHAIKGFTDALRMEMEKEGAPLALTLIKPSSIATPFPEHAKNYMEHEPTLPPPLYAPDAVAEAILHAVVAPQRDVFVGGGGKMLGALGSYVPGLGDKIVGGPVYDQQTTDQPADPHRQDALHQAGKDLNERGTFDAHISESSPYTRVVQSPLLKAALAISAGVALASIVKRLSNKG